MNASRPHPPSTTAQPMALQSVPHQRPLRWEQQGAAMSQWLAPRWRRWGPPVALGIVPAVVAALPLSGPAEGRALIALGAMMGAYAMLLRRWARRFTQLSAAQAARINEGDASVAQEVLALCKTMGFGLKNGRFLCLYNRAILAVICGDFAGACRWFAAAKSQRWRQEKFAALRQNTVLLGAVCLAMLGEDDEAEATLATLDQPVRFAHRDYSAWPRALIALRRGDHQGAVTLFAQRFSAMDSMLGGGTLALAKASYAFALSCSGDEHHRALQDALLSSMRLSQCPAVHRVGGTWPAFGAFLAAQGFVQDAPLPLTIGAPSGASVRMNG